MSKEHPDAEYIKSDDLGLVVAKGMASLYKNQPQNPVDFLGKWLLNYCNVEKQSQKQKEEQETVKEMLQKKAYTEMAANQEKEEKEEEGKAEEEKKQEFFKKLDKSTDLVDEFQDLVNFVKQHTGSTAVYIGQQVVPKKKIEEADNDTAHEDPEANKVIHFLNASDGHEFMVDQVLNQEQGLTFDVFKEDEPVDEPVQEEPEEGEEGAEEKVVKEPEEQFPKHVYVKEVVREPKMHFYRVPQLGAYLAIKLEYDSCLFEGALDAAVSDYFDVQKRKEEQDKAMKEYEEEVAQKQAEAEEGQEVEIEPREWETIAVKPFETQLVSYVVGLNVMGQDRGYTDEQMKFALRQIREYRERWIELEKLNLQSDIDLRLEQIAHDKEYKEHFESIDAQEIEKEIEEALAPKEGDQPEQEQRGDEQARLRFRIWSQLFYSAQRQAELAREREEAKKKEEEAKKKAEEDKKNPPKEEDKTPKKVEKKKEIVTSPKSTANDEEGKGPDLKNYNPIEPEQWQEKILEFTKFHVIKMPRIFQSLFYLLKYQREDICERDTNKLFWKKAKKVWNLDLMKNLSEYNPFGPKEDAYLAYQKVNFIEQNLAGIEQEQVDEYSVALGKLFRWLKLAIQTRKEDIVARKEHKDQLKEERNQAQEKHEEWEKQKQEEMEVARQEWDLKMEAEAAAEAERKAKEAEEAGDEPANAEGKEEEPELPKFDEEGFEAEFVERVPRIEIPPEVIDDIDNDYEGIPESEPAAE